MRPQNLSTNLVVSFLTVLRMQSHTKAAQALNLTQPAVSQHISRLEELLNVKLIERSRGSIIPTKEARLLIPEFERLESSVELMFTKARSVSQKGRDLVRIGTPTSMVSFLLAPIIAKMQADGSDVFPVITEVDDFRVFDMVRSGEVDFALTSMTGNDAELSHVEIIKDRACLVFPAGHELDQSGVVELEEVVQFPLIRPPVGTASERFLSSFQEANKLEFIFSGETTRLMTMEVMARAGLGLLIVPGLSAQMISDDNLRYRPLNTDTAYRQCQIIKARGKRLTPVSQSIVKSLEKRARHLAKKFPQIIMA